MKTFRTFINLLLVIFLLAACAPSASGVSSPSVLPKIDLKKDISEFNAWYTTMVNKQADLQVLIGIRVRVASKYFSTLNTLVANNANCFTNAKNVESAVAQATFDPSQDKGSLVNALVSNTLNAEQATTACIQGNQTIATYVITGRQEMYDADMNMYQAGVFFKRDLSNTIQVKLGNDFLQTYADPTQAEQKMREMGLPGLTDITIPPNEDLFYDMPGNKEKCDYYNGGAFMQNLPRPILDKFYGHEESLRRRYSAQWTPPMGGAQGNCRLFAQAALDQISTPILNQIVITQINTGVDNGNDIPTVQP